MKKNSDSAAVGGAVMVLVLVAGAFVGCASSPTSAGSPGSDGGPAGAGAEAVTDNPELQSLFAANQADRMPGTAPSDWTLMEKNDRARQARVRELLDLGEVKTGRDYYHAAMVYQHSTDADGVQLAHELAMIGACMGDKNSRWLAAASYDRLLMDLKRPQRFGTQYRTDDQGVTKLYKVSAGVTDSMRAALRVPSIREAEEREKEMQRQMDELRRTLKPEGAGK